MNRTPSRQMNYQFLPSLGSETHHFAVDAAMGFAEPVIGRRFAPTRWLNPSYALLLRLIEISQVRRLLALPHRHQEAIGKEIVFLADDDLGVALAAIIFGPL